MYSCIDKSARHEIVLSVHSIDYKNVKCITIDNEITKSVKIDSITDIRLFCKALADIVDTARTDRQYDNINRYKIVITKNNSYEVKFFLCISRVKGIYTSLFSDGFYGWAYGGYRINDSISYVLNKYNFKTY